MSLCEAALSMHSHALATCQKALNLAHKSHDPDFTGQILCDLGSAERELFQDTLARHYFRDAILKTQRVGDMRWQSIAHIQLGELYEKAANWNDALLEFRAAKDLSKVITDPSSMLEAQYAVSGWHMQQGAV
jgi:tetratricopeptide (TPR) repeat protein